MLLLFYFLFKSWISVYTSWDASPCFWRCCQTKKLEKLPPYCGRGLCALVIPNDTRAICLWLGFPKLTWLLTWGEGQISTIQKLWMAWQWQFAWIRVTGESPGVRPGGECWWLGPNPQGPAWLWLVLHSCEPTTHRRSWSSMVQCVKGRGT